MTDVTMPQLGESVTEGTITRWFKNVGDNVEVDEPLFEVSTDKVDTEVPAEVAGVLSEILVAEGDTVDVGTVLARLGGGTDGGGATADGGAATAPPAPPLDDAADSAPSASPESATEAPAEPAPSGDVPPPVPSGSAAAPLLSPVVRRLVEQYSLDPSTLAGTGVGGRLTRDDVIAAAERLGRLGASTAPAPSVAPAPPAPTAPGAAGAAVTGVPDASTTVERLNRIRVLTGHAMVESLNTSPHVITAVEVDYEAVERARLPVRDAFKADEGFSLTYLPFIARAVVDAVREFPHINASVDGDNLLVHQRVHLSIAVDLNFEGLLAPVVRDADEKRIRAIARDISDLAARARSKRLAPDELSGGTLTLSNSGAFGSYLVAPIINQPQVAIISTDGVSRRPVVVTDEHGAESIAIHSVGLLTMSWDHRAFDGAYAAAFLAKVRDILETRDWAAEL